MLASRTASGMTILCACDRDDSSARIPQQENKDKINFE